jgi:rod shape-determining protein MreB
MPPFSLAPEVAIDLGTAMTRVIAPGRGVVDEQPTLLSDRNGDTHPLRSGVIVDIGGAAAVLEPLLKRTRRWGLVKPRALACIPSDASEDERHYLEQATRAAGAGSVVVAPEPLAAAVGCNLDLSSDYPQMLVDFGDGVTDIALFRSGEILTTSTLRIGCSDIRTTLADALLASYSIAIGEAVADRIVREVCSHTSIPDRRFTIASDGSSATVVDVHASTIAVTIRPVIERIADFVSRFVFDLPDDLAVPIIEDGMTATGGGALLAAVRNAVTLQSGIAVNAAADPLRSVIRGAAAMVSQRNLPRFSF